MPLAALTAVGMLATDLYLPAVPSLATSLGGTIEQSQWTLSSFLASLAFSQIVWGWASDRFGESVVLIGGIFLLLIGSALGAVTNQMDILIFARAIQGLGAGASTAAVPSLLRRRFEDASAVRAIAAVGTAESVVPAIGPVIGTWIITYFEWRMTFWVIAVLTLVLAPLTVRILRALPSVQNHSAQKHSILAGIRFLLKNTVYIRLSTAYSLMFGALLMFVGSAPQLVTATLEQPIQSFATLQVLGVIAFAIAASLSGKWVEKRGIRFILNVGGGIQLFSCFLFCFAGLSAVPSFTLTTIAWCLFGIGLGLRGPTTLAISLKSAGQQTGQAAGLLMFLAFGASAVSTAAIAPFLDQGMLPISLAMLAMIAVSWVLTREKSS